VNFSSSSLLTHWSRCILSNSWWQFMVQTIHMLSERSLNFGYNHFERICGKTCGFTSLQFMKAFFTSIQHISQKCGLVFHTSRNTSTSDHSFFNRSFFFLPIGARGVFLSGTVDRLSGVLLSSFLTFGFSSGSSDSTVLIFFWGCFFSIVWIGNWLNSFFQPFCGIAATFQKASHTFQFFAATFTAGDPLFHSVETVASSCEESSWNGCSICWNYSEEISFWAGILRVFASLLRESSTTLFAFDSASLMWWSLACSLSFALCHSRWSSWKLCIKCEKLWIICFFFYPRINCIFYCIVWKRFPLFFCHTWNWNFESVFDLFWIFWKCKI